MGSVVRIMSVGAPNVHSREDDEDFEDDLESDSIDE
jgi:hypothetical protein